jgi:hypothetical protein
MSGADQQAENAWWAHARTYRRLRRMNLGRSAVVYLRSALSLATWEPARSRLAALLAESEPPPAEGAEQPPPRAS